MNQDKLKFFLTYAEQHTVKLSKSRTISRRGVGWEFCTDQECTKCVHIGKQNCHLSIISNDEVEFLKLNHPEYFV